MIQLMKNNPKPKLQIRGYLRNFAILHEKNVKVD